MAPTCAMKSQTAIQSVSDSIWFRATMSSVHRISVQSTNITTAAPTGIMKYEPHHGSNSSSVSLDFLAIAIDAIIHVITNTATSSVSKICHTRKNLCHLGLRVRQPKKKNWYNPKPSAWFVNKLVHAATPFSTRTPAVPKPRTAPMKMLPDVIPPR